MGKKILVIDDEPGVVEIIQVNLEWEGFTILFADNGEWGLEVARSERPDLIILDVMLPGMNGWDVLKNIEADPHIAGTPVLMLTVRAEDQDIIRGLEQGAVEYMTKPFDPLQLVRTVRLLIHEYDERGRQAHRRALIQKRKNLNRPMHSLF
jgi:two-component system alkaline phosphatase synthesis response regulator PhoP